MSTIVSNNFDRVAIIYDALVKIVYGKSVKMAQLHFLNEIPEQGNVLILGGGTGWFLVEFLRVRPLCKVWYVEASRKMLWLSKKKTFAPQSITFIQGTEASISKEMKFDVIITNFYLDLFEPASLKGIIQKIKPLLAKNGLWLISDFADQGKIWQRFLLKLMYTFFQQVCKIEASSLPPWHQCLHKGNLISIRSKLFYKGFIQSSAYRHAEVH